MPARDWHLPAFDSGKIPRKLIESVFDQKGRKSGGVSAVSAGPREFS